MREKEEKWGRREEEGMRGEEEEKGEEEKGEREERERRRRGKRRSGEQEEEQLGRHWEEGAMEGPEGRT